MAPEHHGRWRRFWRWWVPRLLLTALLLFLAVGMALALTISRYGQRDDAAQADVIVILGGGVYRDGRPTPAMIRRALHGAALYRAGYAPFVLCSGGYPAALSISEAAICADLLVEQGIPREVIRLDELSLSTEESAINTRLMMAQEGWQTALVTSDDYHLWRARRLFELHGVPLAGTSPAQATTGTLHPLEYASSLSRETLAVLWQNFKDVLRLPFTHVPYL